jgi:hypothetical protein
MGDTEMIEKIHLLQKESALCNQAIQTLHDHKEMQWKTIEKIKESLSTIKSQIAAFGVINTLVMGFIAYRLVKGLP